jgi:hypothetical protein
MESQIRIDVLHCSLSFEHLISLILAELLDIDIETSQTLGSKSSSLSFKNKIDLIIDIRAMEREDAKKFICFAEIRNQFMHNINVDTFTKCFQNLDGRDRELKKKYGLTDSKDLTEEQLLSKCFDSLFKDISNVIAKLFNKIAEKYYELGKIHGSKMFGDALFEHLMKAAAEFPEQKSVFDEILKRANEQFNSESKKIILPQKAPKRKF